MASPPYMLLLSAYAPALVSDDHRPLAIVHAMEFALAGLRLAWTISDEGHFIALPQRDLWVTEDTRAGAFPLLCNGDEEQLVTLSWLESSASASPGGQPLLDAHAKWPLNEVGLSAAEDILVGVAEGARAFWGQVTPDGAALAIAYQTSPTPAGPPCPPKGLPALQPFWRIQAPELPYYLGWLNYWSAAAARALGFPDASRDAELLSRSRSTATGGWLVRLTDAPLDLDQPAHVDALLRAYERFPRIGGRAPP